MGKGRGNEEVQQVSLANEGYRAAPNNKQPRVTNISIKSIQN
jgi:hypothetical protein